MLKSFFYLLAVIFIGICVYAFVEGVTVITVQSPQGTNEAEGPLKKAIDKNSTVLCEIESFWLEYNIWGDTDTVYAPAENDEKETKKMDESVACEEPSEHDKVGS